MIRSRPRIVALAGALAAASTLAACGADAAAPGGDAGPPQPGGTLRYGLSQAPTCSDPAQAGTNQTLYVTRQIVDSLTDQDPETGELKPWLAQSWEVSPDAKVFTFHLTDGVTFSDGTPLTADSVKQTFDSVLRLGSAKAPLAGSYLTNYVGTTAVDKLTARIEFSKPNAQFLQASSTTQLGILAAATTAKPAEQRCLGDNIGSGPFTYANYRQDASATLAKRTGYQWGSAVFAHRGEAYLDKIEFTVIPESGVRTGSLASGQLDAISDALPQDAPQLEATGGRILSTANPGVPFGFQTNVTRGPLRDPAVRQALLPAIDRKQLVDTVLGPQFKPATSVLAGSTPGYRDFSARLAYDPAKAKSILDQAGWVPGGDGIRVKDGARLSFSVLFSQVFAGNQAIIELVQQQLRQIGVELKLDLVSIAETTARQGTKDFDTSYGNTTRADGDILRTSFGLDGRNLNAREAVPALDNALNGQLSTADTATRNTLIGTAQQQVLDAGLLIPTVELSQAIGASSTTQDLKFEASARLQFFDTWLSGR
ncbi:putative ABC transporter substrate-binding protein [Nocardia brasiliensis NBRC 14402]|uniref:ABC transporter substrate-binding protein n=1 Tax=Nocardia brasiliensis TaxID=37326 RepID=UPI0002D89439|nr:ABC transporter substrate-binding protein [Nocardia brasiliensis]ASF08864.1 ABC transporter substrate-binding protein [Nocardia brasiliensis]GAJ81114.1 putative ABC transporter substrate-binding protein [Nocardia brasiliensis NBRC 14402]SUB40566.1 Nickel-binding periplasmic protein precursor [Nocardia brasiliensis]